MRHERADEPQQVSPVVPDQPQVHSVTGDRVERPVVGGWVDAPPALVRQVGQAGRELEPEQSEQPEDLVGVRRCVGYDLLGPWPDIYVEQDVQDVEAVTYSPRHDDRTDPEYLVADDVEPGHPPAAPEIAGVRPGVDGGHRHYEAHPVCGGDEAAAPGLGELDAGLVGERDKPWEAGAREGDPITPQAEASTTVPAMGSSEVPSDVGDCFLSEWDRDPLWPPDPCPGRARVPGSGRSLARVTLDLVGFKAEPPVRSASRGLSHSPTGWLRWRTIRRTLAVFQGLFEVGGRTVAR